MLEQVSEAVAFIVPLVWGSAAFYLVWGTKRVAPWPYPVGMGLVAALMYLTLHEVPIWFPKGVSPELFTVGLLIGALLVGIEIFIRTIEDFDLGHRNGYIAAGIEYIADKFPSPDEYNAERGGGGESETRQYPRVMMWPLERLVKLHKSFRGGDGGDEAEHAETDAQKRE